MRLSREQVIILIEAIADIDATVSCLLHPDDRKASDAEDREWSKPPWEQAGDDSEAWARLFEQRLRFLADKLADHLGHAAVDPGCICDECHSRIGPTGCCATSRHWLDGRNALRDALRKAGIPNE